MALIGKSSLSVFHEDLAARGGKSAFCVPKVPFCTRKVPHFLTIFPIVGAQFPYLSFPVKIWGKLHTSVEVFSSSSREEHMSM